MTAKSTYSAAARMQLVVDDSGTVAQPGPYSMGATCELSEDRFLTDDVIIKDGDKIMPFSVVDPSTSAVTVEALVLSSGQLSHLCPDAAATSGWSYTVVKTPFDYVSDAAVIGGGFGGQLMVTGPRSLPAPPGATAAAAWLTRVGPGAWSVSGTGTVPEQIGPLSAGVSQEGPYWYGWVVSRHVTPTTDQFGLLLFDPRNAGTQMLTMQLPAAWEETIENTVVLFDPDQVPDGTPTGFAVVLTSDGSISTYNQTGPASFSGQFASALPTTAGSLLWAYTTPGSTTGQPAILWQNENGIVGFQAENGAWNFTGFTYGNPAGDGQVAAWKLNGAYTFTFLNDGLAQVVSEIPGSGSGISWTAPIPLAGGFEKIYSLLADPSQSTLFAADAAQTLNVLTKDPVLGWTQTQVHQDGASIQSVTSWRVQITTLDANQVGVGFGQIRLSTDRPVGFWQASGSTVVTPGTPVTLTAGPSGQVTFSIPAEELDTARLTVQALDSNGNPSGDPLDVTPDIDVQTFLAGQGSLTDIGKLTGPGLVAATIPVDPDNPAGPQAKVFSKLTDTTSAIAVAGAVSHVAQLGLGYQPVTSTAVRSAAFDLTASPATFSTSSDPAAFDSLLGGLGGLSWWDSAKNDADSVFHGLRHGVIAFKKMVTSWSDELAQWTVTLTVDIGDGIDNVMSYVVSDIKSAIHAISSFFQAVGADLKTAWEWLKHNVLELIKYADANAKVIQGWLTQAVAVPDGPLSAIIDHIEISSDTFFTDLKTDVTNDITALATVVEDKLFGTSEPMPPPPTDSKSDDADILFKAGGDIAKVWQHTPCGWLYDKLESHLPKDAGPDFDATVFSQVLADLVNDVVDATATILDLGTVFYDAMKLTAGTKDALNAMSVADFFGALSKLVSDALTLLDKLVDTVLDALKAAVALVGDILTYQYQAVPLIGELLDLAGVDTTLSVGHLMSLIVSYPATLTSKLITKNWNLFPFPAVQAGAAHQEAVGAWHPDLTGFGLNLAAAVGQFVWAVDDLVLDYYAFPVPEGTPNPSTTLYSFIDICCPAILWILQWPTPTIATANGQTVAPFIYNDFDNSQHFGEHGNYLWGVLATGAAPFLTAALAFAAKLTGLDKEGTVGDIVTAAVQTLSGLVNTILGCWYAKDNASSTKLAVEEVIIGVMSNLSYEDTLLGIKQITGDTETISLFVKMVIDTVGNFGTGIGYAANALGALSPPPPS
jgi:hypothetical protein